MSDFRSSVFICGLCYLSFRIEKRLVVLQSAFLIGLGGIQWVLQTRTCRKYTCTYLGVLVGDPSRFCAWISLNLDYDWFLVCIRWIPFGFWFILLVVSWTVNCDWVQATCFTLGITPQYTLPFTDDLTTDFYFVATECVLWLQNDS